MLCPNPSLKTAGCYQRGALAWARPRGVPRARVPSTLLVTPLPQVPSRLSSPGGNRAFRGAAPDFLTLPIGRSPAPRRPIAERRGCRLAAPRTSPSCRYRRHCEEPLGDARARNPEPLSKPRITTNNSNPMEGEDSVALTCEPKTQKTTYLWRINNQSLSEDDRLKLSEDNTTLTLFTVVRTDTGPYECETRNLVSDSRSDPFTLNITYGPDVPIISPSNTHFQTRTNLSLSCHTASNPPAQYSWSVNGELRASSQELFILNISTNNSGSYTCLVYNSVTGLNRTTVKNITVLEAVTLPIIQVINTTVKELESVNLTCSSEDTGISIRWLFNGQSLALKGRMKLSNNNSTLSIDPVRREDSGEYQCEVSNPVSTKRSNPIQLDIIGDNAVRGMRWGLNNTPVWSKRPAEASMQRSSSFRHSPALKELFQGPHLRNRSEDTKQLSDVM
ncbi:carcinoembryonic antigen-related cell adhesion molecule 1 [Cricetulus griseus]